MAHVRSFVRLRVPAPPFGEAFGLLRRKSRRRTSRSVNVPCPSRRKADRCQVSKVPSGQAQPQPERRRPAGHGSMHSPGRASHHLSFFCARGSVLICNTLTAEEGRHRLSHDLLFSARRAPRCSFTSSTKKIEMHFVGHKKHFVRGEDKQSPKIEARWPTSTFPQ